MISKILYLNNWPPEVRNVRTFLPEIADRIIIICLPSLEPEFRAQGLQTIAVDSYSIPAMELLLAKISGKHSISHVISDSEAHVIPAAHLRKALGLPGQNVISAAAFRHKRLMLEYLSGASTFRLPTTIADSNTAQLDAILSDCSQFIIKPEDGTASEGVRLINTVSRDELVKHITPQTLVQEFIPYPIYHLDGLIFHGAIWFFSLSQYINTCFDYACGDFLGNQFVRDANTIARFRKALTEVFTLLPTPYTTTFHVEFFYDIITDDLVFCEAASRTGGGFGAISKSVHYSYGIDLTRELLLSQTVPNYVPVLGELRNDELISGSVRMPNVYETQIDKDLLSEPWIIYHNYAPNPKDDRRLSVVFSLKKNQNVTEFIQNILQRLHWHRK